MICFGQLNIGRGDVSWGLKHTCMFPLSLLLLSFICEHALTRLLKGRTYGADVTCTSQGRGHVRESSQDQQGYPTESKLIIDIGISLTKPFSDQQNHPAKPQIYEQMYLWSYAFQASWLLIMVHYCDNG